MTLTSKISLIINAILIAVVILLRSCQAPCDNSIGGIVSSTTTIKKEGGDTIIKYVSNELPQPDTIRVPVPKYYYNDTGSTKWKYYNIDTAAILSDYFAVLFYQDSVYDIDTISGDTLLLAIVADTVSRNRIVARDFMYQNFRATTTYQTENVLQEQKNKFFIGGHAGGSMNGFYDVGVDVAILTKKDHLYSVGYNALQPWPNFELTGYWNLNFKKLFKRNARDTIRK